MRVSYTLNGKQPVTCTHIGDTPLFYLDNDCSDEIDDLLLEFELLILEENPYMPDYENMPRSLVDAINNQRAQEIMRSNIKLVN